MSLYRGQLIFCCRTAFHDVSRIPSPVVQISDVIAGLFIASLIYNSLVGNGNRVDYIAFFIDRTANY